MQGKMWRVMKAMYESSRSAVLLEGEKLGGCCLRMILWGLVSLRNSYRGL